MTEQLFTDDDLAQWRADAGYINTHVGLFMPETTTMAWRVLALLEEVEIWKKRYAQATRTSSGIEQSISELKDYGPDGCI